MSLERETATGLAPKTMSASGSSLARIKPTVTIVSTTLASLPPNNQMQPTPTSNISAEASVMSTTSTSPGHGPFDLNQCPAYSKILLQNGTNGELSTALVTSPLLYSQGCPVANPTTCQGNVCTAAVMNRNSPIGDYIDRDIPVETVIQEAQDYLTLYYLENNLGEAEMAARIEHVVEEITATGTYKQTYDELEYGVKVAWRNSSRCIYRIQWRKIKVFDCREVKSAEGMYNAVCSHLDFATNGGNIRSAMTVFPQRLAKQRGPRIWNPQLIRYAGYKLDDETTLGDPAHVEITLECIENGWEPPVPQTAFDILPLLIECDGKLICKTIPPELCAQVEIEHPTNPQFKGLGLKWHAVPAISSFGLTIGGMQYTCAPFNGWYMSAEIASRNLSDGCRYNMLPKVAEVMGFELNNRQLWKDKALIELNLAVLYSYDKNNVSIVDHHSATESFMIHMKKEAAKQRFVPGDWIWLVPPISGGVTPVFHQEMLNIFQKPNFLPFETPSHISYPTRELSLSPLKTYFKRQLQKRRSSILFNEFQDGVSIIYATETGTALRFAEELCKIVLKTTSKCSVQSTEEVSLKDLENKPKSKLYIFCISTFGDGDVPSSAKALLADLDSSKNTTCLSNLVFACLGLCNSAYPTFNEGALKITNALKRLGGVEAMPMCAADEVVGQQKMFALWAEAVVSLLKTNEALQIDWTKFNPKSNFTPFKVETVTLLTPNVTTGLVYHLSLSSTMKPLHYSAGDHFAVSIPSDSFARTYSIASSSKISDNRLDLTVKLHTRPDGSYGLCSRFLTLLSPGQEVHGEIRACERYRLPDFLSPSSTGNVHPKSTPVILIGAGTGIAPFRGFLQEFQETQEGLLLFGLRDVNHLLYTEEFKDWQERFTKFSFYHCYSGQMAVKDVNSNHYTGSFTFTRFLSSISKSRNPLQDRQGYVQQVIKSDMAVRKMLTKYLIDREGILYVCGSKAMGKAVFDELCDLFGNDPVTRLRQNSRYREDTY